MKTASRKSKTGCQIIRAGTYCHVASNSSLWKSERPFVQKESWRVEHGILFFTLFLLSFFCCCPIPFNNLADGSHSRATAEPHGHAHRLLPKLMVAARAGRTCRQHHQRPSQGPTPLPTQGSVLLSLGGKNNSNGLLHNPQIWHKSSFKPSDAARKSYGCFRGGRPGAATDLLPCTPWVPRALQHLNTKHRMQLTLFEGVALFQINAKGEEGCWKITVLSFMCVCEHLGLGAGRHECLETSINYV